MILHLEDTTAGDTAEEFLLLYTYLHNDSLGFYCWLPQTNHDHSCMQIPRLAISSAPYIIAAAGLAITGERADLIHPVCSHLHSFLLSSVFNFPFHSFQTNQPSLRHCFSLLLLQDFRIWLKWVFGPPFLRQLKLGGAPNLSHAGTIQAYYSSQTSWRLSVNLFPP